jgi:glycosyltransferase involved in cell wall biosynthesis
MYYDLSIIIPTYKRPELLVRTLESIAPATSCNYEIIVIDDCTEGSGFAPARRFNAKYYCKAGANRGLSSSRNIGVRLARGKYLSFIDDDDFYNPQGLDALLQNIKRNESLIFGNYCVLNGSEMSLTDLSDVTLDKMLVRNHIPVGAYIVEKASMVSDFSENMRSHEDWDFLLNQMTKNGLAYAKCHPVTIDKTRNTIDSMRSRREEFFWLDYLTVYSRHPAPYLSQQRADALQGLGLNMPENMLSFGDVI